MRASETSVAISVIKLCHCETRLRVVATSLLYTVIARPACGSWQSLLLYIVIASVATQSPGRVVYRRAVTPVPLIRGLPRSNFVLPRRDRKNSHATRATSPVSSGEPTPGRVYYCGINILALTASLFDIFGQAFVFYAPYFAINFINADSLLENCLLSASSIFSDEYFSTSALSSVKVFSS